ERRSYEETVSPGPGCVRCGAAVRAFSIACAAPSCIRSARSRSSLAARCAAPKQSVPIPARTSRGPPVRILRVRRACTDPTAMQFPVPAHPGVDDLLWLLLATALVMIMQGGFCLVEAGMVRSKNAINVAFKNVMDLCISIACFALVGCAWMFGETAGGWIGTTGFDFLW